MIAPILPHLAEDVWQHLPFQYVTEDGDIADFVFESRWPNINEKYLTFPEEELDFWAKILEVISSCMNVISLFSENLKHSTLVKKHSLENSIVVSCILNVKSPQSATFFFFSLTA